jgi:hypothetical protein
MERIGRRLVLQCDCSARALQAKHTTEVGGICKLVHRA